MYTCTCILRLSTVFRSTLSVSIGYTSLEVIVFITSNCFYLFIVIIRIILTNFITVIIHRALLEKELEAVGIRLNKRPPDIYFKVSFIQICTIAFMISISLFLSFFLSFFLLLYVGKERWWTVHQLHVDSD